ncbi:PfkB family carbohydrate kinase [Rariglobus hedericola]|uniref:Carbohydrate kinase n=1 Tax=Rariglobus hedericola TaxID=2597822 RepID=A0A556QKL5_9BACT|nr:PfkB family carbohydrate kinase [Rariglobus hedericola]TSJ77190.1 carbohydrate kinase [Rariglobus hedericola]
MPSSVPPRILCFGEILWDFLPAGLFAGGAPFNVGYHLKQHGADVRLVSAIGRDLLGEELLLRLRNWDLDTELITRHSGLPTGYVRAVLGDNGDARYDITTSVAWDQIFMTQDVAQAAVGAQALVFGSLAQRSPFNRTVLNRIFDVLPGRDQAWRVFDVNLRAPHDDLELVRGLAPRATLLKLNAEEAARLCGEWEEIPGKEETHARSLHHIAGCPIICITAGSRGAGLLRDGVWHWEPGRPVEVVDTVGAGDSFLASLLTHLLQRRLSDEESLARACRTGEWVASQRGATPAYPSSSTHLKH